MYSPACRIEPNAAYMKCSTMSILKCIKWTFLHLVLFLDSKIRIPKHFLCQLGIFFTYGTWSSQLPWPLWAAMLFYSMKTEGFVVKYLRYLLCTVLTPVDELWDYVNNDGLFARVTFFYWDKRWNILENMIRVEKELRAGGGGHSTWLQNSETHTVTVQPDGNSRWGNKYELFKEYWCGHYKR